MFRSDNPPGYLCAMSPEQDERHEPTAFALVRNTPEMTAAIAAAYEQLSRGIPGEIEIPITLPIIPARRESELSKSTVPNAKALQCRINALTLFEEGRSCPVGDRICQAFTRFTTSRPANAVLIVSRHRSPRIRTGIRGGRMRYVSAPITHLLPPSWASPPDYRPLRLVPREHHRA